MITLTRWQSAPWLLLLLALLMRTAAAEEPVCIENASIDELKDDRRLAISAA